MENNISQMVKIEESENFHPRRKMTSSLKMAAFLEKFFLGKNTLYKVHPIFQVHSCFG